MSAYLTQKQVLEMLRTFVCEKCQYKLTDQDDCFEMIDLPTGGKKIVLHCPGCGERYSLTQVATPN